MTTRHAPHPPAELLLLYAQATASFGRRVAGVACNQWPTATACRDWTVSRLVGTVTAEQARVPALLAGAAPERGADPSAWASSTARTEPAVAAGPTALIDWTRAAEAARAAFAAPGALNRTVRGNGDTLPAAEYCARLIVELTLHTWDLAHATCQDPHLAPDLVEFALHEAGTRPPADGDPQDRLLNLFGRRPDPPPSLDPEVFG
jgi:uncharacterized protein (TIGR03086 family)